MEGVPFSRNPGLAHQPSPAVCVITRPAVKQAAVVPDHRVADLPWMPLIQFGLSGPFQKIIQQFPALDPSPANNGTCMGSHIIVLQFVGRIGADQFLFYRRKRSGMIGIHRGNLAPGKNIVMDAPQPFDP